MERHLYSQLLRLGVALTLLALPGCNASGTPDLRSGKERSIPTVNSIVGHVVCELYTAMDKHGVIQGTNQSLLRPDAPRYDLWKNLVDDNFASVINLSLQVTNTQGLDPNLSFISPGSVAMTNFSFNVGGQWDHTQDRTFTTNFAIDLSVLSKNQLPSGFLGDQHPETAPCGTKSQIEGDLGLEEIIADGLTSFERTKMYNIWQGNSPNDDTAESVLPSEAELEQRRKAEKEASDAEFKLQSLLPAPENQLQIEALKDTIRKLRPRRRKHRQDPHSARARLAQPSISPSFMV